MAVILAGGCRVSEMNEGSPSVSGTLRIWSQIDLDTGAKAISLRILEFGNGLSPQIRNEDNDEVLYLLENINDSQRWTEKCFITIDDDTHEVTAQTGIFFRAGQTLSVENRSEAPAVFVSSQCPSESGPSSIEKSVQRETRSIPPIIRLSDRAAMPTADRWYRVLVDDEIGSLQVTQFVGSIPPGRAPDHFHHYEEVLFILKGKGRMWADQTHTPIAPGSCVYLPKGQVHCVENTGSSELRLLGVFYPAGSPAVRY